MVSKLAERERAEAARLPQDDIIGILLTQHARIRDLFTEVRDSRGEARKHAFDDLRALLAVHETGEEMILRPVSRRSAGPEVVKARNDEEQKATRMLGRMEKMDVSSPEFEHDLAELEQMVSDHAEAEEREEFPAVRGESNSQDLQKLGRRLRAAEQLAPTHPHPMAAGSPAAQWTVGPFAAMVDRARDAFGGGSGGSGNRANGNGGRKAANGRKANGRK